MAKKLPRVGELRHRIKVTNWIETPDADTLGILRDRQPVMEVWAKLEPTKAINLYGWQSSVGTEEAPTHRVCIRNPSDYLITSRNWLYHQTRRENAWFKVQTVQTMGDDERWLEMMVTKRTFRDVRADPATIDVPNKKPETQENQMQTHYMDAPTLSLGVRANESRSLGRFRK